VTYYNVITKTSTGVMQAHILFNHDDRMPFVAATPPVTSQYGGHVVWQNVTLTYNVPKEYKVILAGPEYSGVYTQTLLFYDYSWSWGAYVENSTTFTVTTPTPTATPTYTPTPSPTGVPPTNTPTPTVTPTYTPYPTPVYGALINELCPVPDEDFNKNGSADKYDEYIEIARMHDGVDVDITGWKIKVFDFATYEETVYVIPRLTILESDKLPYLAIYGYVYMNTDTVYGERKRFTLPDGSACVSLVDTNGVTVDSVCYNAWSFFGSEIQLGLGDIWSRYPDRHPAYWQYTSHSAGWANFVATPTPTPTP